MRQSSPLDSLNPSNSCVHQHSMNKPADRPGEKQHFKKGMELFKRNVVLVEMHFVVFGKENLLIVEP